MTLHITRRTFWNALGVIAIMTVAFFGVFLIEVNREEESKPVIPACELEDGSTQAVCVWEGSKQGNGKGDTIVNMQHGTYSYNITTDEFNDYSNLEGER